MLRDAGEVQTVNLIDEGTPPAGFTGITGGYVLRRDTLSVWYLMVGGVVGVLVVVVLVALLLLFGNAVGVCVLGFFLVRVVLFAGAVGVCECFFLSPLSCWYFIDCIALLYVT